MVNRYLTAQVCLNGHTITRDLEEEGGEKFCSKCGSITITQCDNCSAQLRGRIWGTPIILGNIPPNPFCYNCGKPYPWTREAINTAQELAKDSTELNEEDRLTLTESIPELLTESPRTKLAISRFKKIMSKVGKTTYAEFKDALIEFASRTTKKAIWGD